MAENVGRKAHSVGDFIADRWQDILFRAFQHLSLVVQSVAIAAVIAL